MGNKPPALDLLYWNSDGTRMAQRAHSFYLHNTYLENNLIEPGKLSLLGQPIDLRRIRQDVYAIGAEKDHIVPWRSAWRIAQLTSAKTRFVLAASGHIAGMINPPSKGTIGRTRPMGRRSRRRRRGWPARKSTTAAGGRIGPSGSWPRSGRKTTAMTEGSAVYPPIGDAPGTYVLEK